ncbi:unnamed protein product [Camellia sinensis]
MRRHLLHHHHKDKDKDRDKDSPLSGLEDVMMGYIFGKKKATQVAHSVWRHIVQKGDTVIDATCGNGYDTLAMVKMVADKTHCGHVYAMDVQKVALENASSLLDESLTSYEGIRITSTLGLVYGVMANQGGVGRYGGVNRPSATRRTYPALQRHERIILSQTEPSSRWIDPQFHPIAVRYQSLMQQIEDRFTYDSGIPFDEMAEIQVSLAEEEDNAIEQARTAVQQLRKIQQLKLEAIARAACSDNQYNDKLPEVHQQTCELNEIDEFEVRAGDRVAQIIFEKVSLPRMVEKDARNLCDIRNDERHDARNWRSTEGFGSTGKGALQYKNEDSDGTNYRGLVELFAICHSKMEEVVPKGVPVRLVVFNLGYLPGGDKALITRSETTLQALEAAKRMLASGGLISIVVYVGHPGGREEYEAVQAFASGLPVENWICCKLQMLNRPLAPILVLVLKR